MHCEGSFLDKDYLHDDYYYYYYLLVFTTQRLVEAGKKQRQITQIKHNIMARVYEVAIYKHGQGF